jgi:hypothetical protein
MNLAIQSNNSWCVIVNFYPLLQRIASQQFQQQQRQISWLNDFVGNRRPMNTVIKFVPQQEAWIIERFGKFHRILEPVSLVILHIRRSCTLVVYRVSTFSFRSSTKSNMFKA